MVFPFDARRPSRNGRPRRRPDLSAFVRLETRELMAYSPLGFSLPDLTVVGQAPPVAAYGGQITVTVDVSNLGASSINEPLNLEQGAPSHADAPPSVVGVYLSPRPHGFGPGAVRIGEVSIPTVQQNSTVQVTQTLNMPATAPKGFPGNGKNLYIFFRADDKRQMLELDRTNNVYRAPQPIQLAAALPDLQAIGLQLPPVMQPGDKIQPTIQIANYGTAATAPQGPVEVQLVTSTGVVLTTFTIDNIAPLSSVPSRHTVLGDSTLDIPANVVTLTGPIVTLPSSPASYTVGLRVDPNNTIREIHELVSGPTTSLQEAKPVGPPVHGLPPAAEQGDPASSLNLFPTPAYGPIYSPFFPNDALTPPPLGPGYSSMMMVSSANAASETQGHAGAATVSQAAPGGRLAAWLSRRQAWIAAHQGRLSRFQG